MGGTCVTTNLELFKDGGEDNDGEAEIDKVGMDTEENNKVRCHQVVKLSV